MGWTSLVPFLLVVCSPSEIMISRQCHQPRIFAVPRGPHHIKCGLHMAGMRAVKDDGHPSNGGEQKDNGSAANGMQGSHSLPDLSEEILSPARAGEVNSLVLMGLATCHAVSRFGEQLVGNQVEACTSSSRALIVNLLQSRQLSVVAHINCSRHDLHTSLLAWGHQH